MNAVVATDLGWGIGYKGELLERIPEDMRRFKQITSNGVIVMGRKTFESLPRQKPLPNRVNIVMSKKVEEADWCSKLHFRSSVEDTIKLINGKYVDKEAFIIGGQEIYTQFLPYCNTIYMTKIKKKYKADRFFEDIDIRKDFRLVSGYDHMVHNDIKYAFLVYERVNKDKKISY